MVILDPFDQLLNATAQVLRKTDQTSDGRGVQVQDMAVIQEGVPCRVSTQAKGRPKEDKVGKKAAYEYRTIYMRPYAGAGAPLTRHDWLRTTDELGFVHTYDINNISDPSGAGHHFEILVEEINP